MIIQRPTMLKLNDRIDEERLSFFFCALYIPIDKAFLYFQRVSDQILKECVILIIFIELSPLAVLLIMREIVLYF